MTEVKPGEGAQLDEERERLLGHLGPAAQLHDPVDADRDGIRYAQLPEGHDAGEHQGHQDVEHRADDERREDADRQVALRVLRLLRRRRHGVEADVGEEDDARAGQHAVDAPAEGVHLVAVQRDELLGRDQGGEPGGRRVHEEVRRRDQAEAERDEHQDDRDLDDHDQVVHERALPHAAVEDRRDHERDDGGRHVPDAERLRHAVVQEHLLPRPFREAQHRVGDGNAQRLVQQAQEVARPRRADRHRSEGVLQDEVPPDDPGDELAHRGVAVGVGRTRDRDHRRHLGVADAREGAEDAADHEAVDDARAGVVRRGGARQREDARADDRADAQHREVERRQRALELPAGVGAVRGFAGQRVVGVGDELRQVFLDEQTGHVMSLRT